MFVEKMKKDALNKALASGDEEFGVTTTTSYNEWSRLICECRNLVNFMFFIETNSCCGKGEAEWGGRYYITEPEAVSYFHGMGLKG